MQWYKWCRVSACALTAPAWQLLHRLFARRCQYSSLSTTCRHTNTLRPAYQTCIHQRQTCMSSATTAYRKPCRVHTVPASSSGRSKLSKLISLLVWDSGRYAKDGETSKLAATACRQSSCGHMACCSCCEQNVRSEVLKMVADLQRLDQRSCHAVHAVSLDSAHA